MAACTLARVFITCTKQFNSTSRTYLGTHLLRRTIFRTRINEKYQIVKRKQKMRFGATGYTIGAVTISRGMLLMLGLGKKDDEEDPVVTLFKQARLAQRKKEFDKAERLLHQALKLAAEIQSQNDMSPRDFLFVKTNVFDSLADLALGRGQLEKAEVLYKETMKCCFEIGVEKDDNSVIEISIKLASIYAMQERDEEAEQGLQFCVSVQEKKVNEHDDNDKDTMALLGLSLETYGRYLMYRKQLDKAFPLIEKAVSVAISTLGEEHPQTLVLYNDLATLNILRKNYDSAEETLKKAIVIGQKTSSAEMPAFYCNLGALYLRRSELASARTMCSKAMQLAEKTNDNVSIAQAKKCLNIISKETKKIKTSS